ncbi:SMP-30/gluconolactonase/LRE family protein [Aquamicrobium sp. LC103]|uniref:SMP-30/gluconolactonase/LRE family protein n=1 Tax=Aquamicrobium sp. LC103 TaxID=1120658 RepID=UPI00063E7324|nr:SMP-30/gluconolactonase/LRE family protein [Aquamicrobium sp. LC103]TKT75734.1 SMP-30/gluconolactonase/LRE family protein [Aquamicrobium sp. LC103]
MIAVRTIASGFAYPEGPRWHEDHLWFADQHDETVHILSPDGARVDSLHVEGGPSGMGWLPDGDLLVVSMENHAVLRRSGSGFTAYCDLGYIHRHLTNEMVVDATGRAYVGNIGFDFEAGDPVTPTMLVMVNTDGRPRVVAEDLVCPNGTVITPDGKTLIIAESLANRLTAFDILSDGGLSNRRVFAEVPSHIPDGICLDAEGGVWAASPFTNSVIRVREGGEITDTVTIDGAGAFACMLGGSDGRDLYVCVANPSMRPETVQKRGGRIDVARVSVPAATGARP